MRWTVERYIVGKECRNTGGCGKVNLTVWRKEYSIDWCGVGEDGLAVAKVNGVSECMSICGR